ncbi:hypothetical protein KA012_01905 [Candidatus Woesebacteria bacterium]|nr:hypothetical protein [Candidatus Woesebacteria bacterium]
MAYAEQSIKPDLSFSTSIVIPTGLPIIDGSNAGQAGRVYIDREKGVCIELQILLAIQRKPNLLGKISLEKSP